MTSPHPDDTEAMIRHLDELLPSLRMAWAKAKHINHPDLKHTELGLDDCISEVKGLRREYIERRDADLVEEPYPNAPSRTEAFGRGWQSTKG